MSDDKSTDTTTSSAADMPFRLPKPDVADNRSVMSYADDLSAAIIKATAKLEKLKVERDEVRAEIASADAMFDDLKRSKRIDKATLAYVTTRHTATGNAKRSRAKRED